MKKSVGIFAIALLASITTSGAFAQSVFSHSKNELHENHDNEGRIFAGGAISFWSDTKDKSTTLDLCPEIGYLFNDRWGAGLLLGYEYERKEEEMLKSTSHAFKISPFVRYYYLHKGPFNLYMDGGFGLNFSKEKKGDVQERLKGFEIGVRPGVCVDLTEGLCLCLRMGFAGYRNDYFMGEEPKMGNKGFGLRFAPEELMIGLELEF